MATMFGRFEVQSELSKSETALIYKALDTETNQVVALKTQSLESLGDRADAFVDALIAEGEKTRDLVGQNIVLLYGAGEIDGQFCASMEYIQGNSIATMLARKEGFSIWDLLDITRQVCSGLEHAAAKGVAHHSLEPAKIMVQWDGMVKILGYGISNMSLIEAESGRGLGRLMPYCSPEQIRGEEIDLRSNIFTLGAILYEMVVSQKAFDATDPVALVNQIENDNPPAPSSVNSRINPTVSSLIMKALAKDPGERYQNARELLDDLEKCKENKKAAPETKRTVAAPKAAVDPAARAAAASKFVSAGSSSPKAGAPIQAVAPRPAAPKPVQAVAPKAAPRVVAKELAAQTAPPMAAPVIENRAAAAAAGAGSSQVADADFSQHESKFDTSFETELDTVPDSTPASDAVESDFEFQSANEPVMSAAVEEETETESPSVAVDPMMSAPAAEAAATSFSDLEEMPPLKVKEPVIEPTVPEPVELPQSSRPVTQIYPRKDEKPKIQPREVAEKAINEIATIPPRLMLFSILGAVAVILVIAITVYFHVRTEDDGSTAAPKPTKAAAQTPAPAQPVVQAPVTQPVIEAQPETAAPINGINEPKPNLKVRQIEKRASNARRAPAPAPPPVPTAGQALVDSTPQGAQFQVDGKSDPSWVTPFTVSSLSPGKHVVSVSKAGYSAEVRSIDVAAGGQSSLLLHLAPVNALMVVNTTPPGAEVVLDGKPTGRVTPAQFAVEKGTHTLLLRKQGFLEETVTTDLGPAQNFQFSPALRALGNAEDIKTVGKFNKLFGHGSDSTAGMGAISIHTQPKGAQVAINQRVLDKLSPVDVMMGPGNYIVDITATGFKPVHKIVTVDKGGKVAIDEVLDRQ